MLHDSTYDIWVVLMSRIDTKYGVCSIGSMGYYKVTSAKEGNQGKSLHCLIWEDHYGKPVPKGYNIHHINGNKLDNRIQNLQCVEHKIHSSFHSRGKITSLETRRKMSDAQCGEKCKLYRKDLDPKYIKVEALKGKLNSDLAKELNCSMETIRRRLKKVCNDEEYEWIKFQNRSLRQR